MSRVSPLTIATFVKGSNSSIKRRPEAICTVSWHLKRVFFKVKQKDSNGFLHKKMMAVRKTVPNYCKSFKTNDTTFSKLAGQGNDYKFSLKKLSYVSSSN